MLEDKRAIQTNNIANVWAIPSKTTIGNNIRERLLEKQLRGKEKSSRDRKNKNKVDQFGTTIN